MESSNKGPRGRVVIYAAIGIAAFAILVAILISGFSIGTLTGTTTTTPFGAAGPPEIIMINNSTRYEGEQYGYTFSETSESFLELPEINSVQLTTISVDNIVSVEPGSQIEFVIEGSPPRQLQPDTLSVSVYTEDGTPVAVLDNVSPEPSVTEVQSYSTTCNQGSNIFSYQQQHGLTLKRAQH